MGDRRRRLPFSIRICIYTAGGAEEEILFAMPETPRSSMENRCQHGGPWWQQPPRKNPGSAGGCLFNFPQCKWWKSIECAAETPEFPLASCENIYSVQRRVKRKCDCQATTDFDPNFQSQHRRYEYMYIGGGWWAVQAANDTHSLKLTFNANTMTVILIVFGCCGNLCYGCNCYGQSEVSGESIFMIWALYQLKDCEGIFGSTSWTRIILSIYLNFLVKSWKNFLLFVKNNMC